MIEPSVGTPDQMADRAAEFQRQTESRFGKLRRAARRRMVADAIRYTSAYRDVPAIAHQWMDNSDGDKPSLPIVMAGHQPTLFHPGVWFKNFALDRFARQSGSLAINLVVDNDVSSGVSIPVPQQDVVTQRWRAIAVAYDVSGGGVPYEQTAITDRDFFRSFDQRLRIELLGFIDNPLITAMWPHAVSALDRCEIASCAIAQARHGLEAEIGLQTLELPIGVMARDKSFARFTLELLADLPRLITIYNDSADHYRHEHGIRSHAHPVPNLGVEIDADGTTWYECPLWLYGDDSTHRRGMWCRRQGDQLTLSDRRGESMMVDMSDLDAAAVQWADSLTSNFKVRPRALLTTMYSRWILSDCFLHGIGGGKYDQLGDRIAQQFFGITPPPYYVTSATIQLPGVETINVAGDRRRLRRKLRDCQFQPEVIDYDWDDQQKMLIVEKRELLAKIPPRGQRRKWHQELESINQTLSAALDATGAEILVQLEQLQRQSAATRLLTSREHPFCIYPLDYLVETFDQMLSENIDLAKLAP